jgi:hypothetical protein
VGERAGEHAGECVGELTNCRVGTGEGGRVELSLLPCFIDVDENRQ